MTSANCVQCNATIIPEDSVYDDHSAQFFCEMTCFYGWVDDNDEEVVAFYVKLNVTD